MSDKLLQKFLLFVRQSDPAAIDVLCLSATIVTMAIGLFVWWALS